MTYRAPSFINAKETKQSAVSEKLQANLKGDFVVIHAYNFKYDINGNKINHYIAVLVRNVEQSLNSVIVQGLTHGKGVNSLCLIECTKQRKQGDKYGMSNALYNLEGLGYDLEDVTTVKSVGTDGFVAAFKIK